MNSNSVAAMSMLGTHDTYPSASNVSGIAGGSTLIGRTFYVPLRLWFSADPSLGVPLLAMTKTMLRLVVKTRDLNDLVVNNNTNDNDVVGNDGTSVRAYGEFVYLDRDQAKFYAHNNHQYLIDVPVELAQDVSLDDAWHTVKLDAFEHLSKELVWLVTPREPRQHVEGTFTTTGNNSRIHGLRVPPRRTATSNNWTVQASYGVAAYDVGTELVVGSDDLTFDTTATTDRFEIGDVVRVGASELHSLTLVVSETSELDVPTKFRLLRVHTNQLTDDDFVGLLAYNPTQTRFRNVYVEFSGEADSGDTIDVSAEDAVTIRNLREDATALDTEDWFNVGDVLTLGSRAYALAVDHAAPEAETRCTLRVTAVSTSTGAPTELEVISRDLLQVGPTTYAYDTLVSVTKSDVQTYPDGTATQQLQLADVETFTELPTLDNVARTYDEYVNTFVPTRLRRQQLSQDTVERAQLRFGATPRTHEHEGRYFSCVQPARHHGQRNFGLLQRDMYVYSFANSPRNMEPSGACNLSAVRGLNLRLLLRNYDEPSSSNATVRVFSVQHCIL